MLTPRSMEIWPSSGDSCFVIRRKTVDLPAPFGPTRPTFSPRWMAAEASTNRICGPCCLLIWSRRITGGRCLYRETPCAARPAVQPARARGSMSPAPGFLGLLLPEVVAGGRHEGHRVARVAEVGELQGGTKVQIAHAVAGTKRHTE